VLVPGCPGGHQQLRFVTSPTMMVFCHSVGNNVSSPCASLHSKVDFEYADVGILDSKWSHHRLVEGKPTLALVSSSSKVLLYTLAHDGPTGQLNLSKVIRSNEGAVFVLVVSQLWQNPHASLPSFVCKCQ